MINESKILFKVGVIMIFIIILLKLSLVFLWPFLFALILILVMEPLVKSLISRGFKRHISVILTFFIYSVIVLILGVYIWNYVGGRLIHIGDLLPRIIDTYRDYPILSSFNDNYERIFDEIKKLLLEYKEKILTTIISTVSGTVYIFIVILAALFMSLDLEYLSERLRLTLGIKLYSPLRNSLSNINKLIIIEFKLVSITIIISTISFMILGFDDSLSIGMICGILDILPIVGPLIIFLPIVLYLFTTKQIFIGVGLIFTYILIIIVRQIVEIKLLQGDLVLKPIFVLFSLYCGVLIFGALGVLFGPLVLIMFKEVYSSIEKGDQNYL